MNNLKISVITPSYNQGQFLERTILSIINQNYPNVEHIIIDGGSTDNSVEIIKKYETRIAYWVSEKDKGQTDAINKGMRKATGDIVCWINSDDILLSGALQVVARYFNRHPDIEFLNGLTVHIDKDDKILRIGHILNSKWFHKRGMYNISQQGMFWKKCIFEKVGELDETFHYSMDVEWIVRLYENKIRMARINKPLGAIRMHEFTKTTTLANSNNLWRGDHKKIGEKYNGKYTILNRKKILIYLYGVIKLIKGMYLQDWLFYKKYFNKHINQLSIK
jgi:glycosyltransferase involved in cell wall biosynthesis